jgi:hypothetical protein
VQGESLGGGAAPIPFSIFNVLVVLAAAIKQLFVLRVQKPTQHRRLSDWFCPKLADQSWNQATSRKGIRPFQITLFDNFGQLAAAFDVAQDKSLRAQLAGLLLF